MSALLLVQKLSGCSSVFAGAVRSGQPFIWQGATDSWPLGGLKDFDCEKFSSEFPDAFARDEKATGGISDILKNKNWTHPEIQTFCGKSQAIPTVWHVKDEALDGDKAKFVKLFPGLPETLSPLQNAHLRDSAEVWLQPEGAGVLAHVDGYCSGLVSIQLRGRKWWRIMYPPMFEDISAEFFDDSDGGIYSSNSSTKFIPDAEFWVEEGEALFLPPGMLHETLSPVGGGCTVSVTALVRSPLPTGYLRKYLPGMSILGDRERCMHEWSPLALLRNAPDESAYNFSFVRTAEVFEKADIDLDGYLDAGEVLSFLRDTREGRKLVRSSVLRYLGFTVAPLPEILSGEIEGLLASETLGFWDSNGDGVASVDEVKSFMKLFMKNLFRSRLVEASNGSQDSLELVDIASSYYDKYDFSLTCVLAFLFCF